MSTPGTFVVDGSTGDVLTIAAPPTPSWIEITNIDLTVSATSTVTIKSGSTVIDKAYLGTGNGYNRASGTQGPVLRGNPGEDVTINNSAGTIAGGGVYRVVGVNASNTAAQS